MQIRQSEDAVDIPELEPIHLFLSKNIPNTNRKRKVLRESVTVDKNGKIFLIECILFLDNSYEISINDISRQEEESRMKRQLTQNVAHELKLLSAVSRVISKRSSAIRSCRTTNASSSSNAATRKARG